MKKNCRIFLSAFLMNVILIASVFAQDEEKVFKCNPVLDSVIFGTGLTIYGTELILEKGAEINQKEFDGILFDKNDVNGFDRLFMNPYSKPIDTAADVMLITTLATPLVLAATEKKSEWMTIGLMYAETVLLAQSVKEMSKLFINRARPYMYYEGFPEKDVYDDLDWNNSCPSGHSVLSFTGATFLSYVFCCYNPDSKWKYPVIIGSCALATATSVLRVAGGNHFATDIIFGAAIGGGIGFLVPFLHSLAAKNSEDEEIIILKNKISLSAMPLGIRCNIRL